MTVTFAYQTALSLILLWVGAWMGRRIATSLHANGIDLGGRVSISTAPQIFRVLALFCLALLLLLFIVVKPQALWSFPAWVQVLGPFLIHAAITISATILIFLWVFAKGKAHRARLLCGSFASICLLMAILWGRWPIASQLSDRLDDEVVLQTSSSSCAAAAAANLLRARGHHASEREMAALFGTTASGTFPGQVLLGLQRRGVRARYDRFQIDQIPEGQTQGILFVGTASARDINHAVALLGMKQGTFEIVDPLFGRVYWSRERLEQRWSGYAVILASP